MRTFITGATRTSGIKPQYDKYLSPLVLQAYAEFGLKNSMLPDGTQRPLSNWKCGMPTDVYLESAFRHFMDLWLHHEGYSERTVETTEDSLMAILFNINGYAHETLKQKYERERDNKTTN